MTESNARRFGNEAIPQSLRYVCIGTLASTTDSLAYFALTRYCALSPFLANFISVNIGITVSFFLNAFLNFRKTNHLARRAIAFYGVCYFGMTISMCLLAVGTRILGFPDMPVKIAAVIIAGSFQFLFNRLITFSEKVAPRARERGIRAESLHAVSQPRKGNQSFWESEGTNAMLDPAPPADPKLDPQTQPCRFSFASMGKRY